MQVSAPPYITPDESSSEKKNLSELPEDVSRLIQIFNTTFFSDYNTVLVAGGQEPLYTPATASGPAKIIFSHDYFASALHEIAHWCVAGANRRELEDYGYWYAPDGRSESQQQAFEQVEVRPQALEWVFSVAAGKPFKVSADNLALGLGPSESFKRAIHQQALVFCDTGLPLRPQLFVAALEREFGPKGALHASHFCYAAL